MDFREVPIPGVILYHTGKPDGDDAGYRDVAVCEEDVAGQGDPLVELDSRIARYAVYAQGAKPGICSAYGSGLGAPSTMLVRQPVNAALLEVDEILEPYGCRIIVLDAFRSVETQRRLWKYLFDGLLGGRHAFDLSVPEFIELGIKADNIGSYVAIVEDDGYKKSQEDVMNSERWLRILRAGENRGMSPEESLKLWLTFHANNGTVEDLTFDTTSNTAHGGGGAVDAILADMNGKPLNLGVPFDYVGPESEMNYFERDGACDVYRLAISNSEILHDHWGRLFDEETIIREGVDEIRRNRRLLYHAMMKVGATFYVAECWHWNFGNERGGRQFDRYPGAGSGCHSLLKNVRNPETGKWIAVWGNDWAQRRAAEMLG